MEPVDVPTDQPIVRTVARNHERVTGRPPATSEMVDCAKVLALTALEVCG